MDLRYEPRGRCTAGDPRLEFESVTDPASNVVDELSPRHPKFDLVVAWLVDVPRHTDHLHACRPLGSDRCICGPGVLNDPRDIGDRFHVVDDRWLCIETLNGRERRLEPRLATASFEAVEQRCFFTTDVGATAEMDRDFERVVAALDVGSEIARFVRFLDGMLETSRCFGILAPDVDKGVANTKGVTRNGDALEKLVRVAFGELAVVEGPRLGFIAVDNEVAWFCRGEEPPLDTHREPGSTAASHVRCLDFCDDIVARHVEQGLAQRCVSAGFEVSAQCVAVAWISNHAACEDQVAHASVPADP